MVNRLKRTRPRTEPCETPQVRGSKGNCAEGPYNTIDVRDERNEVNYCSETEEMPNQVERRWSRMEWLRVSKTADGSRRQRQETCCMEMALES